MTRPLLVLRPQPGCDATVARALALGLRAVALPLFAIEPVAHDVPDPAGFDALLLTSANAARHGGDVLAAFAHLPVHAVGAASAEAARAAGALEVHMGGGDIAATLPALGRYRHVLHLCGEEVRPFDAGAVAVTRCTVYRAAALPGREAALAAALPGVALVHSPRAGARLAALVTLRNRASLRVAAISAAAAAACGAGWGALESAGEPTDAALLALGKNLCDEAVRS